MEDRKRTPNPNAISDRRIMIWHIAIFALAAFLDFQMGLRVPGAERVINAQVANGHTTFGESRARRTDGIGYRIGFARNSTVASHP